MHLINLILLLNQSLLSDKSQILLDPVVFIDFLLFKILKFTLVDSCILQLFSITDDKLLFFLFALLYVFLLPFLIFPVFLQDLLNLLYLFSFVKLFIFKLNFLFLSHEFHSTFDVLWMFNILWKWFHYILHLFLTFSHYYLLVFCPEVFFVSLLLGLNPLEINCCIE